METSLQTDVEMIKQIESLIDRCVVAGIMKDVSSISSAFLSLICYLSGFVI